MKKILLRKWPVIAWITGLFVLGLLGCEEPAGIGPQGKDRYLDPPWLGGSSIEMLEDTVNYSTFLALMDKANYREPIDKQLFTLFVPNDDAFKAYFQKIGRSGIDDLSEDEAVSLFTLHVLPNARSAYQLKYEYLWDELQGPTGEYASLFFRKPTNSATIPYKETVRYNKVHKGKELTIYNEVNKYVPLFSKDFFEDFFGALDGSDYLFMYPESQWGDNLNYHNAMVTDAEVRTSSGFIYFVDQVVGPIPSIEQYFNQNQDKYGLFYDLAQRFATYGNAKRRIEDNTIMYVKSYDQIEDIASEILPSDQVPTYYKDIRSIFVPTDEALQNYLNNTVLKYYPSIDSVPDITISTILNTHIAKSLALISKVEKSYFNYYGDPTDISRNDIIACTMCSNGPFYVLNKVLEPNIFKCASGRLYFDKNYTTFLQAMRAADKIAQVSDLEQDVTLFAVDNNEMIAANIRYNEINDAIQTRGSDGQWTAINEEVLIEFLEDHIYFGKLEDLSGEGYIQMLSKNYVHYKNGKLEAGKNVSLNEKVSIEGAATEGLNGLLYSVDHAIKTNYEFGEMLMDDPDCSEFANLLIEAGFLNPDFVDPFTLDTIPDLRFIAELYYWTAFIPSNEAVQAAIADGTIPTDPDRLKDFLSYHFIRRDVIFDDGNKSGAFDTQSIAEVTPTGTVYNKLQVSNSTNSLKVTDNSGQIVTIDHNNANNLVRYGVIHKIPSVLKK